ILISVLLAIAFWLSWPVALLFVLGSGLLLVVLKGRILIGRHLGTQITAQNSALQQATQEHLNAAKLIKASGTEDQSLNIFADLVRQVTDTEIQAYSSSFRIAALFNPMVSAQLALMLYI